MVTLDTQEYELFVSAVAHELRGPLTTVLGFSHRLNRRLIEGRTVDAADREELNLVEEHALSLERSIAMLSELLVVSGGHAPSRVDVSLSEILRDLIDETQGRFPPVVFTLRTPRRGAVVEADYEAARIAMRNLIENAGKYSRTTVSVVVHVSPSGAAEIRVRDSCGGLSDDELAGMFLPHHRGASRRSSRGLGMGLYLTDRICDSLGWAIQVENHPGDGCTFSVAIPPHSTAT